jgi:formimidoylglutamate deiminase
MKAFQFDGIFLGKNWMEPGFISVDDDGKILDVSEKFEGPSEKLEMVQGYLIPGFLNSHSHGFQYAMAGLAEYLPLGSGHDDFWSWRKAMYKLANNITPESLESVARMLYSEMLRMGITEVAEFHYLHHDSNGNKFENLSEMGERMLQAAQDVGIRITLIPKFYQKGNFGTEIAQGQRRFLSKSCDDYLDLVEATRLSVSRYSNASLGVGAHSIRAVEKRDLIRMSEETDPNIPFHIHIAEQVKEVEGSLEHYNKRPVEFLLENLKLGPRYSLVHSTHMTESETKALAETGANVVICPSTEGNLGDGFFPLLDYMKHKGSFSFGTDSHINLNPLEELRLLDYGQRLQVKKRNVICTKEGEDSGEKLFNEFYNGGQLAMGRAAQDIFEKGTPFDGVVLKKDHPVLVGKDKSRRMSACLYSGDVSIIKGTIVGGEWVVKEGRHLKEKDIFPGYEKAMINLLKEI